MAAARRDVVALATLALLVGLATGAGSTDRGADPSGLRAWVDATIADDTPAQVRVLDLPVFTRVSIHFADAPPGADGSRVPPYTLVRGDGRLDLRFDRAIAADLSAAAAVGRVSDIAVASAPDEPLALTLHIPPMAGITDFPDGDRLVVDIVGELAAGPPVAGLGAVAPAAGAADGGVAVPPVDPLDRLLRRTAAAPGDDDRPIAPPLPGVRPGDEPAGDPEPEHAALQSDTATGEPADAPSVSAAPATDAAQAEDPGDSETADAVGPPMIADFDLAAETGLTAFRRGASLWLVFAGDEALDATALAVAAARGFGDAHVAPAHGGVAVRVPLRGSARPQVRRNGTVWTVDLADEPAPPGLPLEVRAEPEFLLGPRLFIAVPETRHIVRFEDPEVGDVLFAAPVPRVGYAMAAHRELVEAAVPATAQGLVVVPYSTSVRVAVTVGGIEIGHTDGLVLSTRHDPEPVELVPTPEEHHSLFDVRDWRGEESFLDDRSALFAAIGDATEEQADRRRLDLARFFFGYGYATEAAAVLSRIEEGSPAAIAHPEYRALRGAVRVLMREPESALADFDDPQLVDEPEIALWRGAALGLQERWSEAYRDFTMSGRSIEAFPQPLAEFLMLLSAEAALRSGDLASAEARLNWLVTDTGERASSWPSVIYLRGLIARADGNPAAARRAWAEVSERDDRYYRVLAEMAQVDLDVEAGRTTPREAAAHLEGLRFAWRGDGLEFRLLERLGNLHWQGGEYRDALTTWQRAIDAFSTLPAAAALADRRDARFVELYDTALLQSVSPSIAVGLFQDYAEFVPDGAVGDRMTRRLADRLVDMDLLKRAADLFMVLADDRLQGAAARSVATRAAALRILDGETATALAMLEGLAAETIDADLRFEQRLLMAKALTNLQRGPAALALLADEGGLADDQRTLVQAARLDIAWRIHDWPAAAAVLRDRVGAPPPIGQAIDPAQAQLVIDYGIALALADDRRALDRLAVAFGPSMEETAEANIFAIVTRAEGAAGPIADLASVRRQVSEVDLFETFLAGYLGPEEDAPLTN